MKRTNKAAISAANYAHDCVMHRHRGVLDCGGQVILFGNDNYSEDERSQEEVDLIRRELIDLGIEVSALGISDDGGSWALVVEADERLDPDDMERRLRGCWEQACGMDAIQTL